MVTVDRSLKCCTKNTTQKPTRSACGDEGLEQRFVVESCNDEGLEPQWACGHK